MRASRPTCSAERQIEQGAPADVFISASIDWMDYLQSAELIRAGSRTDLLGNRLVLVAHGAERAAIELDASLDLAGLLGDEKLAMALVDAVPAGIYGRQALSSLGLWDAVAHPRLRRPTMCVPRWRWWLQVKRLTALSMQAMPFPTAA
jgi:molybdenum ABC transporter molybdate-binding protein